jgi:hypothetical protein
LQSMCLTVVPGRHVESQAILFHLPRQSVGKSPRPPLLQNRA